MNKFFIVSFIYKFVFLTARWSHRKWKNRVNYSPVIILLMLISAPIASEENKILSPVSGRMIDEDTILPADVLARVNYLNEILDQIRVEIGKPRNIQPEIDVTNVSPREVYFQALVMFRKADRLAFEWTKTKKIEPPLIPSSSIKPFHVFNNVNATIERISSIKELLKIPETSQEKIVDETSQPTDVFKTIVQVNRQINSLLTKKIQPTDVFIQVDLALNYTKALLAQFPEKVNIEKPGFVRKKSPSDVYKLLYENFKIIEQIFAMSNQKIMGLNIDKNNKSITTPGDVYAISLILVSELAYLHSGNRITSKRQSIKIISSDVFQHAEYLKRHLEALLIQLKKSQSNLVLNNAKY